MGSLDVNKGLKFMRSATSVSCLGLTARCPLGKKKGRVLVYYLTSPEISPFDVALQSLQFFTCVTRAFQSAFVVEEGTNEEPSV